jgi:hypothetical protein
MRQRVEMRTSQTATRTGALRAPFLFRQTQNPIPTTREGFGTRARKIRYLAHLSGTSTILTTAIRPREYLVGRGRYRAYRESVSERRIQHCRASPHSRLLGQLGSSGNFRRLPAYFSCTALQAEMSVTFRTGGVLRRLPLNIALPGQISVAIRADFPPNLHCP